MRSSIIAACGLAAGLIAFSGCNKPADNAEKEPPKNNPPPSGYSGLEAVPRGYEIQEVQNALRQIALLAQAHVTEYNQPPKQEELKADLKKAAPKYYKLITDGHIVLVDKPSRNPGALLAYEKDADRNHNRLVVFNDGSVQKLNEEAFAAALQNKGS